MVAHDDDGPVVLSERECSVLRRLEQDLEGSPDRTGSRCDGADLGERPPRGEVAFALLATASTIWVAAFVGGEVAGLVAGLVTGLAALGTVLVRRYGRPGVRARGSSGRSAPGAS